MTDAIKWSDIVAGREEAFALLYDQYSDLLYGYGMKILPDEAAVMDAIQSLMMNIFEKRRLIAVPKSIAAYLCRALKNALINEMQSAHARNTQGIDDLAGGENYNFNLELDAESSLIATEDDREKFGIFQAELNKLSRQQREMLYLRYYKGLEIDEVAQVLGVSKRTVYNTTNNALTRLRENKLLARHFSQSALMVLLSIGEFYCF